MKSNIPVVGLYNARRKYIFPPGSILVKVVIAARD
jgi:hypothetical protein